MRDLVNHVVGEDLWTAPLLVGATIEDVGDRLDGDLVGDDPIAAGRASAAAARSSVAEHLPRGGTVHLSYGEERAEEYVMQLAADHLVHAWDLAAAVGGDRVLDPEAVAGVSAWFVNRAVLYRDAGLVGEHVDRGRDPQARAARLLRAGRRLGRQPRGPGGALGGVRPRRRRRDHGADDRGLRLRGDRTRRPTGSGTRERPPYARSGSSCSATTREPLFTEEELIVVRRPRRAALALQLA